MSVESTKYRQTGSYTTLGNIKSFIPYPLPPSNPPFNYTQELVNLHGETMHNIGRLNEASKLLPNMERFIKAYCLKEALLSSAIEGIHTNLIDIFTKEIGAKLSPKQSNKQTQLVLNYNLALKEVNQMVIDDGLPIVSRVILRAHEILMGKGEGDKASPGQYRKQQVSVGKLVPAPAKEIPNLISDLEKFINSNKSLPALIKAGLTHVQFEIIHPFLDGNGRIGRLLIVLMLLKEKVIKAPLLYPSIYFKNNHLEYYKKLDEVRAKGDFEGWIKFYLKAINESSKSAYKKAQDINKLEQKMLQKIRSTKNLNFPEKQIEKTMSAIFRFPVISVTEFQNELEVSYNTANSLISKLNEIEVLSLETYQKRNKLYRFDSYLELLDK